MSRRPPVISEKDKAHIRRVLCQPVNAGWLRCPAKDSRKSFTFAKEGDDSHLAGGHVCEKCRCSAVAGSGTKGDFYGLGEHTGHYGVGFCYRHERGRRAGVALSYARNQMLSLQQVGRAEHPGEDQIKVMEYEAQISQENQEIRQGILLVKKTLEDFQKLVDDKSLTETGKFGPRPASDATRIGLACQVARTLSALVKEKYAIESGDYIHVDELKTRIPQMISLAYRFILNDLDRSKFIQEFKGIWIGVHTGARQMTGGRYNGNASKASHDVDYHSDDKRTGSVLG